MNSIAKTREQTLMEEIELLRARLQSTAMQPADVAQDIAAFVILEPSGDRVYTLQTAIRELNQSDARFRMMADTVCDILFIASADGSCEYVNNRFYELTGLQPNSALGDGWKAALHPDDAERNHERWLEALQSQTRYENAMRLRTADGSYRWFVSRSQPVKDSHGQVLHWVGCCSDIHDLKIASEALRASEKKLGENRNRLEELVAERTAELETFHEKLRLAERMASLGTLSAGLGHDMSNLLLPIRMRLDSIEDHSKAPNVHEDVQAIRTCTDYLQRLARGLRMFALDPRLSGPDSSTNIVEWWNDVEVFFKSTLSHSIELQHEFQDYLPAVSLCGPGLTQVVFNLMQNANHALHNQSGGKVLVWAQADHDARCVRVGVRDNGPGMPADVKRRCFEPFFTTKTRGPSTGLGLSLVHGIVHASGGSVDIESEPGSGTTFILNLPFSKATFDSSAHQHMQYLRAVVSMPESRQRAFIASMLQSLDFDVGFGNETSANDAQLWITNVTERTASSVVQFVDGAAERYVLALGDLAVHEQSPKIVVLDQSPKPTIIRSALRQIAANIAANSGTL